MMKKIIVILISLTTVVLAIGIGSVFISPKDIAQVLAHKIFNTETNISPITIGIIFDIRLPRVMLAFIAGLILSVTGVVMQSILKNPLASSYTLGISSGAAFGVGLMVFLKVNLDLLGIFTLPIIGFVFGIFTVIISVSFSSRLDQDMGSQTIILVGTVFSLFINSLLMIIYSISGESLQRIVYWQMGSVALKDWVFIYILFPIGIIGTIILTSYSLELDNLTFGEEAAYVVGVDSKKTKWLLLCVSSAMTGCCVSIVGIIGFIDLIIPHIVRKLFGSSHRIVLPMSGILGGALMVVADCIARTIISPSELPIGAITALIGAPFFIYVYFNKRVVK